MVRQQVIGSQVQRMFGSIAARYDVTNTVLSGGVHHLWRKVLLEMVDPDPRARVLDVCTGTADLIPLLRKRFGTVLGIDFCHEMLAVGQKKLSANTQNGSAEVLAQGDALRLPFPDQSFDLITVAFGVRNLERLSDGLKEFLRILRPQGKLLVLEFGQPKGVIFPALFRFHQRHIMPIIGGLLTGNRQAYQYLPATSQNFPCREQFMAILKDSGFTPQRYRSLTGGIAYAYLAAKPGK